MTDAIRFEQVIPILRIFDVAKADEFYLGFLGFTVDWEHRCDESAPLYRQISRDGLILHLSEHHGDGSPGARLRLMMRGCARLAQIAPRSAAEKYSHRGTTRIDHITGPSEVLLGLISSAAARARLPAGRRRSIASYS